MKVGSQLPDDLILIHERNDHYSLQAKKEMTLDGEPNLSNCFVTKCSAINSLPELNTKITNFLEVKGQCLTKEQWLQRYPQPTESCLYLTNKSRMRRNEENEVLG
jgi:hypothetical protein